jgi:hypothetical protein
MGRIDYQIIKYYDDVVKHHEDEIEQNNVNNTFPYIPSIS